MTRRTSRPISRWVGTVLLAAATTTAAAGCTGTVEGGANPGTPPAGGGQQPPGPGGGAPGPGNPGNPGTPGNPGNPGNPANPGNPPVAGPETPGHTPLRRLSREQYNNTVRDLLGMSGDFSAAFSGDDDVGGFRTNGISPVSEPQVEQYLRAAEDLATRAVAGPGLARLSPCVPPAMPEMTCADRFVRTFGKRAFRRPLAADEVTRYLGVYNVGRGPTADFAGGVSLVIATMLQSPHLLYLPENGDPRGAEPNALPLERYELASRLSYFLVGSLPDDELFAAADADALRTPEQVAAQARRLLKTPRARDSIASFYTQWLELTDMHVLDKDVMSFPDFTPALRTAMRDEVGAFVNHVTLAGDGKLASLLTATFAFPAGPLHKLYGLAGNGAAMVTTPVELPRGQRAGILTLAGVMALYAHPDQTGPVGRGYMVSDKLLCITPPPAPDDVNVMLPKPDPAVTTRERLEQHRADPRCATCHALMDPYGLTFENYDAIGRWRANDGRKPVDATAKGLPGVGDVKDAVELMARLAVSPQVRDCLTRQWFRYGFGRVEGTTDNPTLGLALGGFARADHSVPELLVALASSKGFRYRTPVGRP
jgi:hypothetical protein